MVGCCFVTVLLFLPCVCCEDVAIVISGGPDWRNVSFHLNGTLSFYRMVADGARMANDLEANGYKVHFLYSMAMANFVGGNFPSIDGVSYFSRGGQTWPCALGANVIGQPNKTATLAALAAIPVSRGDNVIVYIRSHGFRGGFFGPTGEPIFYRDILNVFRHRGWKGEMLWLVDACFSGLLVREKSMFKRAARHGIHCQFITSAGNDKKQPWGISDFDIILRPLRTIVSSGSYFRHRLMLAVDTSLRGGGRDNWQPIVGILHRTIVRYIDPRRLVPINRSMGSEYRCYKCTKKMSGDWFWHKSGEPNLGSRNSVRNLVESRRSRDGSRNELLMYGALSYGSCQGVDQSPGALRQVLAENEAFRALVEWVHRDLRVRIDRSQKAGELGRVDADRLAQVVTKVSECWPLRIGPFVPDFDIFRNLIKKVSSRRILRSIERAAEHVDLAAVRKAANR